jgi:hypothetical protein
MDLFDRNIFDYHIFDVGSFTSTWGKIGVLRRRRNRKRLKKG